VFIYLQITQKYITEPPRIFVGYKSLTLYSRSSKSLLRMWDIGLIWLLSLKKIQT